MIDSELAELTYDSVDDLAMANVRSTGVATAKLTFEEPTTTVEIEVEVMDRERRLNGQLVPAQSGHVEVRIGRNRSAAAGNHRSQARCEVLAGLGDDWCRSVSRCF